MTKPPIAFFGLGIMGSGMARRLLAAGFPLAVYNRDPKKAEPLASEGARICKSSADAADGADILISMVADDKASREVWLGDGGALRTTRPGCICIECSTLSVSWVRQLASVASGQDCELLDAPVTGSKVHAESGQLLFVMGGSEGAVETVRPVLSAMGRGIVRLGPSGSGAWQKLINNFLGGVQIASLAQAVALIERSGIDREKSLELLTNGSPGSPIVKTIAERMVASDYRPNFSLRLLAKDLAYALSESRGLSLELSTAATALSLLQEAISAGHGEADMSAVVEVLRNR